MIDFDQIDLRREATQLRVEHRYSSSTSEKKQKSDYKDVD